MALSVPDNLREPWSRITDSRILRPRDELRLVTAGRIAVIGVLDSHDPSTLYAPTLNQIVGLAAPSLPDHHHILVQLDGDEDVISTGMYVGQGEADELVFRHITRGQRPDGDFRDRLRRLHSVLEAGSLGLYYMSAQETLSATPMGQQYLAPGGNLDVDAPAPPPPPMPPI